MSVSAASSLPWCRSGVSGRVTLDTALETLPSLSAAGIYIEQPMRVLPLMRFAAGCKSAALAQMREHPIAWELADQAAKAQGDDLVGGSMAQPMAAAAAAVGGHPSANGGTGHRALGIGCPAGEV